MADYSRLKTHLGDPNFPVPDIVEYIRTCQVHEINQQRQTYGEYHHLFKLLRKYPDKFQEYMRMNIDTFDYILFNVGEKLEKNWCNRHTQPILPEEQLVLTLRFLATGMSYGSLAFAFRMGKSTVYEIIKRTMNVIWDEMCPFHMPVPTTEKLFDISESFHRKWDFPHCLGAIDGRHIAIKQPNNSGSLYYNYKNYHSIVLQAVVGPDYRFLFIDAGGYGRQHDSATLSASEFYLALKKNIIKLPKADFLPGTTTSVPYFFIGDGAYPLMENLLKPYPGQNLPTEERNFNKRLSRARMVVECAFGQVCKKWGIFNTTIQCQPDMVEMITKVTCLLHNVIIDFENPNFTDDTIEASKERFVKIVEPCDVDFDPFPVGNGHQVREKVKKFVNEHPM